MPITALPTPPSRSDPDNFAERGDAFMAALPTFVTEANALEAEYEAAADAAATAAAEAVLASKADLSGAAFTGQVSVNGGALLAGTTTSRSVGGAARTVQIETNGQASTSIIRNSANALGPALVMGKTRGAAVGASDAVTANDELGVVQCVGADGTDLGSTSVAMHAHVDGTVSTGVVPGRWSVWTTNSSGVLTERLRINSGGNSGQNVTPSASWWTSVRSYEIGRAGNGIFGATGDDEINVGANVINTGSGTYIYGATDTASLYRQAAGQHVWYNASSGSSGASITLTEIMRTDTSGRLLIGTTANPDENKVNILDSSSFGLGIYRDVDVTASGAASELISLGARNGTTQTTAARIVGTLDNPATAGSLDLQTRTSGSLTTKVRIDSDGNLLVGETSGTSHRISKSVAVGTTALDIQGGGGLFCGMDSNAFNAANSAFKIGMTTATGRSINAAGTVNASGADYAEYMVKADTCGVVAKGQIVGVNTDGKLTDKWAESISFLIKSTDPSYVGGDRWGGEDALGMQRPVEPQFTPPSYDGAADPGEAPRAPVEPEEGASEEQIAAYENALAQYQQAAADYERAKSNFEQNRAAYTAKVEIAKQIFDTATYPIYLQQRSTFEAALEAARQKVDRIAYAGQVPVNVTGATPGQYVVPVQDGEGIGATLVDSALITFDQYRRAVGIVQNILPDGRANVRVKVA